MKARLKFGTARSFLHDTGMIGIEFILPVAVHR